LKALRPARASPKRGKLTLSTMLVVPPDDSHRALR
jgi:hypothetical protein